jgi:cysteine dioxygenase
MPQCQPLDATTIPAQTYYTLDNLIRDIKTHLGDSSGIGCPDVDEDYLMSLAQKYASNPNDWARYYYNCPGKNYTRNAIENINNKANIVCIPPTPIAEARH